MYIVFPNLPIYISNSKQIIIISGISHHDSINYFSNGHIFVYIYIYEYMFSFMYMWMHVYIYVYIFLIYKLTYNYKKNVYHYIIINTSLTMISSIISLTDIFIHLCKTFRSFHLFTYIYVYVLTLFDISCITYHDFIDHFSNGYIYTMMQNILI
jgi:hypothetical protein